MSDRASPFGPGDVLSYSAGSTQTGPDGYRRVAASTRVLEIFKAHWPDLLDTIGARVPLVINAYPATLGRFEDGVFVDTYLSPKTASRALQLAAAEGMPVILLSQPLIFADMLLAYVARGLPLPDCLIVIVGGYVMPCSLQRALEAACGDSARALHFVHGYGTAEVDAGLLLARERDTDGELLYRRRGPDVTVHTDDGRLLVSLRSAGGSVLAERFDTGDFGAQRERGIVVRNSESRLHTAVRACLEAWSEEDWRRRTGFLSREGAWHFQLREGAEPRVPEEVPFHEFGQRFGFSWLSKPRWG